MPSTIKTQAEIKIIREGGKLLAQILEHVIAKARPGITTRELDVYAEKLILKVGGVPSFKGYQSHKDDPPFPSTLCTSVNEQLVHTPASDYQLKDGDILSVDIGMRYPAQNGFYTDMARTIPIGTVSAESQKVIDVTRESFAKGLAQVKPGNSIADIGRAVQEYVEAQGFSVVRQLVGHGVGYAVHEDPRVPNFYDPKFEDIKIKKGMVLAIEPMVNVGDYKISTLEDGWTIIAADGKLCAHHENTIAVTDDGAEILTQA